MAAAWRGAWRLTRGGGDGDPAQQPDCNYDNCGASSTASGTTLSNTTTSTVASLPFPFTTPGGVVTDEEKATMREHIRDLIHAGSRGGGAATSDGSSALGRWLSELQVGWVLHLAQLDTASAGRTFVSRRLQHTARSWVRALHVISWSIVSFAGWQEDALELWPAASEFAGFIAATLLLMLPFADAVVALDDVANPAGCSDEHGGIACGSKGGAVASAHKFQALTDVRDALSGVSEQVQLWHSWLSRSCSSPDATEEAARISGEMRSLLLVKLDKLDDAMRNTRDCIRTQFMSLTTDDQDHTASSSELDPSLLPGIHVTTQFAVSYIIIVLSTSYSYSRSSVDPPDVEHGNTTSSSTNLITVIIRSLEASLTRVSQLFPDQSLRFIFLTNNFHFLWHQLVCKNLLFDVTITDALARKIDGYMNRYLHVSWTSVLKPLQNRTPCCFSFMMIRYSAQRKFLAEFEKTYAAQKLWKVPDPELRKVLRTAIVDKVTSALTKFLEDDGVGASRVVSPESLQEMLEELFEG